MEKESWLQEKIPSKQEINAIAFSHDLYHCPHSGNILSQADR